MDHWDCRFCNALTADDQITCWNWNRRRDARLPVPTRDSGELPATAESANAIELSGNQLNIAVAVIGALSFLFGLIRFNSLESQLTRLGGGKDELGILFIAFGALCAVAGTIGFFSAIAPDSAASPDDHPTSAKRKLAATFCTECGSGVGSASKFCEACGTKLTPPQIPPN